MRELAEVPIRDLLHSLSYAHPAANAAQGENPYPRWATWIGSGKVARVIEELRVVQERFGPPPASKTARNSGPARSPNPPFNSAPTTSANRNR